MARKQNTPNDPERRERILDATMTLLQDGGIAAVTARAVAGRANVPVGSVSYHFDSVRALLLEAAHRIIELRDRSLEEWGESVTRSTITDRLAELIHEQITTGRNVTVVAYELYLLGLRDEDFRALSVETTTVLSRQLAKHVGDAEAWRLATVADGLQLHSLFLTEAPSPASLTTALSRDLPSEGA